MLQGRDRRRHFEFHGVKGAAYAGFEQLRVADEFVLHVDYELPDRRFLAELEKPIGRAQPVLAVRQYHREEQVGGNAIRLRMKR